MKNDPYFCCYILGEDPEEYSKRINKLEHLRSKKENKMNDNVINTEELVQIPADAITNIRIIEGNDTDGETRVIEVAPDTVDIPVDVTVH